MKSKQCLDVQQMQHLQELGMELDYDTLYRYVKFEDTDWMLKPFSDLNIIGISHRYIPSYTLQDVLDAHPKYYHIAHIGWTKLSIRVHTTKEWEIGYVYTDELSKYAYGCRICGKELIDAAYSMLCWAIENKFVETNKNE